MIAVRTEQGLRPAINRPSGEPGRSEYPPAPANLSMRCVAPPHLKYNITCIEGGVLLSIWEPAPKSDVRVKPFLFMTRHRLPSELEAKKLLAHYLSVYKKATQTTPQM
ncbi:MAG: hypothetical protein EDM05_67705 [Leptolyngbya sp. IPPAS B-1204]|uniref:Uncharacterized protein n=1 Tax=Leptolyngbya sp. NK1-12 TaxID=2547451 RepID=A0AA96WUZ0_9CYAN|nr:hypothetical protein [Leptolyngbya sp. NK1-12]MBF2048889.1 hypothetical protein [Elainella sp. C42_A2020_010]RNJ69106.1 MAG: hypothetical protein EDM05_11315 [Leptolyngbya sp. IPPAS B-1204]WNZ23907.1 hypothetical protein HJG54_14270 [Leptolyngbya sp. NK1-12]